MNTTEILQGLKKNKPYTQSQNCTCEKCVAWEAAIDSAIAALGDGAAEHDRIVRNTIQSCMVLIVECGSLSEADTRLAEWRDRLGKELVAAAPQNKEG